MKVYRATLNIPRWKFEFANKALEIDDFDNLTRDYMKGEGFCTDDTLHLGHTDMLEDGNVISINLYSGSTNYWLEWYMTGETDVYWDADELTEGENELTLEDTATTYIVNIKIVD